MDGLTGQSEISMVSGNERREQDEGCIVEKPVPLSRAGEVFLSYRWM